MDKISLKERLLEKSKEAFALAIEIYNKPTIKYRVEGFSFFICNAWELMLKAYMIEKFDEASIYYKDNPSRTISLENCIQKIFTNAKSPIRKNLEKIIELRNLSTHFITEEYEMVYIPLFQSCVLNFNEKMQEFHNIDLTKIVPENFLTLSVSMRSLDENFIRAKYPEEIASKLISTESSLKPLIAEGNHAFAIKIEHYHYITKNKNQATSYVHITHDADVGVQIIKELKDPNTTHKYSAKNCIKEVKKRLEKQKISIFYKNNPVDFNMHHFSLFCEYYSLKDNQKFCYVNSIFSSPQYSYSIQAIDFIVEEIKKDPDNIIQNLKNKIKK